MAELKGKGKFGALIQEARKPENRRIRNARNNRARKPENQKDSKSETG